GESRRRWETGQDSRAGLCVLTVGRTRKRSDRRVLVVPMQRCSLVRLRERARGETGCREGRLRSISRVVELAAEKSTGREGRVRPNRKPTQVGEARSLKCSSDPWRRNSAN